MPGLPSPVLAKRSLDGFVSSLAHRIAGFPGAGHVVVKDRVNAIALAPAEDLRRDSDLFVEGLRSPETQNRLQAAFKRGSRRGTMNWLLVSWRPMEKKHNGRRTVERCSAARAVWRPTRPNVCGS